MTKLVPKIDGKSITESATILMERWKYRKYKDDYVLVIWINAENTFVKQYDGKIKGVNLHIKSIDTEKLIDKIYVYADKKVVTKVCFVKEDISSTLDILATDVSGINQDLLKSLVKIKLMEGLDGFNLGQVILGMSIGFFLGFLVCILAYGLL